MELSLEKQAIVEAFDRGYIITENGDVISPRGLILSKFKNKKGYLEFAYRMKNGHKKNIKIHMYQAYMKFGDMSLIVKAVNHIDENKTNNHIDNIQLSTLEEAYRRGLKTKQKKREG